MSRCIRCETEFHDSEPRCPVCGVPPEQVEVRLARRCGPWAFFFLQFAWVVAFLSGIGTAVMGIVAFANGHPMNGILLLCVGVPVALGHYIAFGLVMQFAERRP